MARFHWVLPLLLLTALSATIAYSAESSPLAPQPTTASLPRDEKSIVTDLHSVNEQLASLMPSLPIIADADFRAKNGAKVAPIVHQMANLFAELRASQSDPSVREKIDADRFLYLAILVALNDPAAIASLNEQASHTDAMTLPARSALALGDWWRNSKDPAAQTKTLADYTELAKANPSADRIAITLASMSNLGAANEDLSKAAMEPVRATLTSPVAKQIIASVDAGQATKELMGKPLIVAGRTSTGGAFSSESLKGKVVMVDFWATWCGPCNAELPRVKELYANFHAKGLEIVGVDCDDADDTVNAFTKSHEMPWTQLRETSQSQDQWHPLAKLWHVDGIPTMFLIDRKGTLRYVDAREDTQTKINQLLAESDQ